MLIFVRKKLKTKIKTEFRADEKAFLSEVKKRRIFLFAYRNYENFIIRIELFF